MTQRQSEVLRRLRLEWQERFKKETNPPVIHNSIVYLEIEGVTVTIGPSGGLYVPAVRSFPNAFRAAADADELWARQRLRDDKTDRATAFKTGHFNSRVDHTGRCIGDRLCPNCKQIS